MKFTRTFAVFIILITVFSTSSFAAAATAPKDSEVTGVHRGYTNDELYLRLDNDKEMKFLVRIPGDTEWKWHKTADINDRITVTYHQEAGEKRPVATAIRKVAK